MYTLLLRVERRATVLLIHDAPARQTQRVRYREAHLKSARENGHATGWVYSEARKYIPNPDAPYDRGMDLYDGPLKDDEGRVTYTLRIRASGGTHGHRSLCRCTLEAIRKTCKQKNA